MKFEELRTKAGAWLQGTGPNSDIVISSRVRLARNVVGYPFLAKISESEKSELEKTIREKIEALKLAELYLPLNELTEQDRLFLVERHLISIELAEQEGARSVAIGQNEMLSIMVNEEDHIRIQVMHSGLMLREVLDIANSVDDLLESKLEYSFSPRLGYLTACPTNIGTGIRVSVMLHLPGLAITKQLGQVFQALAKINLVVRGLYGEGTEAMGDFFQISNQVTLGKREEEIVGNLERIIPEIINHERHCRKLLFEKDRRRLEDRICRSLGMLRSAKIISSQETTSLLSAVRLGINLKVCDFIPVSLINELFIFTQPVHLQKIEGRILSPEDRDWIRAEYIRNRLSEYLGGK